MPAYNDLTYPGNYPGSSGYGILEGGRYGQLTTSPKQTVSRPDYAVWDVSSGKVISILTGKPFTGKDPRTGLTFDNGVQSAASAESAASATPFEDRYKAREVIKSPEVAAQTTNLMNQFKANADSALTDFNSHLADFKKDIASARTASQTATNIEPTIAALTAAQQQYGQGLDQSTAAYRQALADSASNTRNVVTQAQNLLPQYDTALNNILANQLALVQGNVNRYKMGTGTPTSMGSSENRILANAALQAALPIEQQKIQRRYDILTGMAMPVEQQIGGQNITFAGSYLPGVASSRYQSASQLPLQIQALRDKVAGMTYQDAINYMRSVGIPAELQNQILSQEAGVLGQLGQLEDVARYRGLENVAGADVSQPVYYNMGTPGYPMGGGGARYGATPNLGANAPREVGAGQGVPSYTGAPTTGTIGTGTLGYGRYGGVSSTPSGVQYSTDPMVNDLVAIYGNSPELQYWLQQNGYGGWTGGIQDYRTPNTPTGAVGTGYINYTPEEYAGGVGTYGENF